MKKVSIGWIFSIIAALGLGAIISFSWYFTNLGNYTVGLIWAVLTTLVMLIMVFGLTIVKKVSHAIDFKKMAGVEILLLLLFVLLTVIAWGESNHYFKVLDKKNEIGEEVFLQVNQVDGMFTSYNTHVENRLQAYDMYLREVERGRNERLKREAGLKDASREALCVKLESEISCGEMQPKIEQWKNSILRKTTGVGLIVLLPNVTRIKETLESTKQELIRMDHSSDKGVNEYWSYDLQVNNGILNHFAKEEGEGFSVLALIVVLVLSLIMLLPYIAAERSGIHKGLVWELFHNRQTPGSKTNTNIGGI